MGLLDGAYNVDPIAQGLLGFAGAMMTPRALGGGVGPAMTAFNQNALAGAQMKRQMAMDAERQRMLQERADMDRQRFGFERDQTQAQADAQRAQAQRIAGVRQYVAQNQPELLQAFDLNPGAVVSQLLPQKRDPVKLGQGDMLLDPTTYKPLAENPKAPTQSDLARLINEMGALPDGDPRRAFYMDAIRKATTHAPAPNMSVSYGAPFTGVDPATGKPMLYQPNNRGLPPVPTGLAPPPDKPKDLPEAAAKQVVGARNLRDAVAAYTAELQNWDRFAVVSPQRVAKMDTLYNNMMLLAKEAYNLGVLNGPDYDIMTRVVTPPASFKGMLYGSKALADQAATLSGIASGIERQVIGAHQAARQSAPTTPTEPAQSSAPKVIQFDENGNRRR